MSITFGSEYILIDLIKKFVTLNEHFKTKTDIHKSFKPCIYILSFVNIFF